MTGSRYIHDPETFKNIKVNESSAYFKDNRIFTCSHILKKNDGIGKTIAIAYPL